MKPTLHLDLTRSLVPAVGAFRLGQHGDLPAPEATLDPQLGLPFPLKSGGFVFAGDGLIDDAAGTLEIVFTPASDRPVGALVHAWGQYAPLVGLAGEGIEMNVYGRKISNCVRFQARVPCRLTLSWDHRCGVTMRARVGKGPEQAVRRRLAWQAFRQEYVPFCVGGAATEPRFRKWSGDFAGWVRSLRVWRRPLDVPGPVSLHESGEAILPPFRVPPGIKVLEFHDPPIAPDPLCLVQLPHRLADLRRTREVADLDRVVQRCAGEIEVFSMLTWHVSRLWPHCNYWPWWPGEQRAIFWQRGHEMIPPIRAGRMGGMCGGFAHVMEEIFWSMGFDARRIQVRSHSSFEAYSNEQDRWIICDASYNEGCYLFGDGRGCFFGCADLIRRHEALEHNPDALADVRRLNCRQENLVDITDAPGNPVSAYDHLGIATDKTREYGERASSPRGTTGYAWYFREPERAWFRSEKTDMGPRNFHVKSLDELCPSRNRVRAAWSWTRPGEALRLDVEAVGVTFFDTFIASVDGGPPERTGPRIAWRLYSGVNTLSVRTRNKLGALGHPLRVVLWKRPA